MQLLHRALHVAREHERHDRQPAFDRGLDQRLDRTAIAVARSPGSGAEPVRRGEGASERLDDRLLDLLRIGARGGRVLVWIYLSTALLLVVSGRSRASYLAVAYPMVLPLGAVALAGLIPDRLVRATLVLVLVLLGGVAIPFVLPVLPVRTFVRYQEALNQAPRTDERQAMGVLPQQYADMFGWEQMVGLVHEAYARLTPEERARCRIFGQNYGEAGAVDVLGRRLGLPPAISGHNSYWLWGPGECTGEVVIVIEGDLEEMRRLFATVELAATHHCTDCMPYEDDLPIYLARGLRQPLAEIWPGLAHYD